MKLERIPHIYHDTKYARKIFEIISVKYTEVRKMYKIVENFYNLDKLEGFALDLRGQNISVPRNGRTDLEYRKILLFEYLQLVKLGNLDDMRTVLQLYFDVEVNIKELSGKVVIITSVENRDELHKKVSELKAAGVGFIVTDDEYIEDYTIKELESLTIERIGVIKIAKR